MLDTFRRDLVPSGATWQQCRARAGAVHRRSSFQYWNEPAYSSPHLTPRLDRDIRIPREVRSRDFMGALSYLARSAETHFLRSLPERLGVLGGP